ncbi:MAG: hypothetical protein C4B59_11260 [Candidatus Methanogaster sp.]|uniref:Uncharacterized protein n=1 Tax=Candidatus Methanogaster sp. TaxID=3386292 RepID=A0AC61L0M3_9EURY|nr:MAG: hypothetical protein C4B59_11260 [ANME-2 cluster archaeon]
MVLCLIENFVAGYHKPPYGAGLVFRDFHAFPAHSGNCVHAFLGLEVIPAETAGCGFRSLLWFVCVIVFTFALLLEISYNMKCGL